MSGRAGSRRVELPARRGSAPTVSIDRAVAHTVLEAKETEMVVRVQREGDYQFARDGERIVVHLRAGEDTLVPIHLKPVTEGIAIRYGSRFGYLPRRQWVVVS